MFDIQLLVGTADRQKDRHRHRQTESERCKQTRQTSFNVPEQWNNTVIIITITIRLHFFSIILTWWLRVRSPWTGWTATCRRARWSLGGSHLLPANTPWAVGTSSPCLEAYCSLWSGRWRAARYKMGSFIKPLSHTFFLVFSPESRKWWLKAPLRTWGAGKDGSPLGPLHQSGWAGLRRSWAIAAERPESTEHRRTGWKTSLTPYYRCFKKENNIVDTPRSDCFPLCRCTGH